MLNYTYNFVLQKGPTLARVARQCGGVIVTEALDLWRVPTDKGTSSWRTQARDIS